MLHTFEFIEPKHLICKTTLKYYSMNSSDIISECVCKYRYVEVNLVQEKNSELKKSGELREKPCFKRQRSLQSASALLDSSCRIFTTFMLYVRSRMSAESFPKWKSYAWSATDLQLQGESS